MIETGIVSKIIENNCCHVEFEGSASCGKCGICFKSGNKLSIIANNSVDARVGDAVEVEIAPKNVLWSTFLIFIMPILVLMLLYQLGGMLISIISMFAYFVGLYIYDKYFMSKEIKCNVVRILR